MKCYKYVSLSALRQFFHKEDIKQKQKKANVSIYTPQPLYNMVRFNMVLDKMRLKDGPQKCIDYIEKWP